MQEPTGRTPGADTGPVGAVEGGTGDPASVAPDPTGTTRDPAGALSAPPSAVAAPPSGVAAPTAIASVPGPVSSPAAGPGASITRASVEALAADVLPALIARLGASDLGELEVRTPSWRIRLRRAPTGPGSSGAVASGPGSASAASGDGQRRVVTGGASARSQGGGAERGRQAGGGAGEPVMAGGSSSSQRTDPRAPQPPERRAATSPAVGYFGPREEVRRGLRVQAGDLLGSVDVLGVRQEVSSPIDGFVLRQVALAGEAVEYGQPLVEIEALPARSRGDAEPPGSPEEAAVESAPGVGSVGAGGSAVAVGEVR